VRRGAPGEDTAVYVACSTLCFAKLSLEDAFQAIREMHFQKADLAIHARGPHLTPAEVATDLGRTAQRLKAANLALAAFHVGFDAGPHDAALQEQLRAVCRLARVSTVPLVTIAAAPLGSDFQAEAARLRCWVKTATAEGVMLAVETHSETLTADPLGALELCRVVPGLVLTLDPSHYMVGPHAPINYDALFPLIRHVRLRDTTMNPPQFQVRVGQGEIEYGRIISQLHRFGYERALAVDVREEWSHSFPAAAEVRKLKYLLESLV
jgi:sugar phosphate isomerase/epimerase